MSKQTTIGQIVAAEDAIISIRAGKVGGAAATKIGRVTKFMLSEIADHKSVQKSFIEKISPPDADGNISLKKGDKGFDECLKFISDSKKVVIENNFEPISTNDIVEIKTLSADNIESLIEIGILFDPDDIMKIETPQIVKNIDV